jgi:hypothetical protein
MPQVMLTGRRPGLHKIALTKLLMAQANMHLKEAHDCTHRLTTMGEVVCIDLPLLAAATQLALAAEALGACAKIASDPEQANLADAPH